MGATQKWHLNFEYLVHLFKPILLLSCVMVAAECPAQGFSLPYKHFTPHDGLAGMVNQVLFQDSRGYIWVASNEGIAYYNGYEFKRIDDHASFSTEFIFFVEEDDEGRILLLSETHLTLFDGREYRAIPLPMNASGGVIRLRDHAPPLIGISDRDTFNIFELIGDSLLAPVVVDEVREIDQIETLEGERIITISKGKVYVAEEKGVSAYKLDEYREFSFHQSAMSSFPNLGFSVRKFLHSPYEYMIFNRYEGKVFIFTSIEDFYESNKEDYLLHRNPPGKTGDFLYLPELGQYMEIPEFPQDLIWRSFQDRSDQLWVSTNNGLYKFFLNGIFQLESEPAAYTWGVSEWQGRLMYHSYLDGLIYWENERWNHIPNTHSNGELFPGRATSSENFHFVPAWDGIFAVDKNFDTYFLETERYAEGLYFDSLENELIAADESNLYFFDGENLTLRERIPLPAEASRVGIFSIRESGDDLWLSGPGGVIRFDRENREFQSFTLSNNKLPCKSAVNIFVDEWEQIWVTGNCGLMWWNSEREIFEKMDGFSQNVSLVDMIDLGESRYMISGNKGLFVVDIERSERGDDAPSSLRILKEFNHHNGFDGIKPFLSGFFRDSEDRIWVSTASGTFVVDPRFLDLGLSEARMKVTSVDDEKMPFNKPFESEFTLPYGQRNVNVGFDMICYNWPGQPGFQYRLSPKSDWSPPQTDKNIRALDLGHGTHSLEIRAVFSDRPQQDWPYVTAGLRVELPFWERSWFPLFVAGLVSLLIVAAGGAWIYNRRMRLKHFQTHNQLQLLQIHTLESQLNPHFIFNVLTNIQKKVVMDEPEKANDMIVNLGKLMRNYLESIESGIQKGNQLHRTSLAGELELIRLYMDFEREKYPGKFRYRIEVEKGIDLDTTVIFPMLIQPFIENSIKHGFTGLDREGEIHIRIYRKGSGLCIEVVDDGIGRSASMEKLRDQKQAYRSKGNLLVSRRVELLQKLGHEVGLETVDLKQGTLVRIYSPVFHS